VAVAVRELGYEHEWGSNHICDRFAGASLPPVAGRTSTLAKPQRGAVGVHPSPLDGKCPVGAPPFGPPRMEAVGSSSGTRTGGQPTSLGPIRATDALSPEEEERQCWELHRVFGVTPEDVARAR